MKKREAWIDILKGIAMLMVILGHSYGCPSKIVMWVSSFHIAMFLFLSGVTLNVNMSFRSYLGKKLQSLLRPYLIYSVVYVVMRNIINGEVFNCVDWLKQLGINLIQLPGACDYALWFLIALFFAELLVYPIIKYASQKSCIMLIFLCSVIEALYIRIIGKQLPLDAQCWLTAVSYVGAGYIFKTYRPKLEEKLKNLSLVKELLIISFLWIVNLVCAFANWKISGSGADIATLHMGNYFLYYTAAFSAIMACILLVQVLGWHLNLLQLIGRNSLVMYCTHYYFLWIMQKVLFAGSLSTMRIYVSVIIAALVASVGSLGVSLLMNAVKKIIMGVER